MLQTGVWTDLDYLLGIVGLGVHYITLETIYSGPK